jgi:hypothetical protein
MFHPLIRYFILKLHHLVFLLNDYFFSDLWNSIESVPLEYVILINRIEIENPIKNNNGNIDEEIILVIIPAIRANKGKMKFLLMDCLERDILCIEILFSINMVVKWNYF